MKATGIVRRLDQLGRIVLPVELRRNFGVEFGTTLETYVEGESIMLKKYEPTCTFCEEPGKLEVFKDKMIFPECRKNLKNVSIEYYR